MNLQEHRDKHMETLKQLDAQRQQLVQTLNQTNEQILRVQGAVLALDELMKETNETQP